MSEIVVIAGGVGAARYLRGLVEVHDPSRVTAIVNVADDFVVHGLYICPDLDTVRSTLIDDVGPQGWGRANETWQVMNELRLLGAGAPQTSRATDWFSLGDRDLAIHLYRTQRMREGATLAEVICELCMETGVRTRLLPVTNDVVQTRITTTDDEQIDFQEYFVARKHDVAVERIDFIGIDTAKAAPKVLEAISTARTIIIAPSNPFVSIAPVVGVEGVADALRERRDDVVAISPIVDGRALKGPAGRMLEDLGYTSSVTSIAQMWTAFASTLLIDETDEPHTSAVVGAGMKPVVCNTVMSDIENSARLATASLTAIR